MGTATSAECECGYREDILLIGRGMRIPDGFHAFPGYCSKCTNIVALDLGTPPYGCDQHPDVEVLPYDHPSMIAEQGEVLLGGSLPGEPPGPVLRTGRYLCPACRTFGLGFAISPILWD